MAVDTEARGMELGKSLTQVCIDKAKFQKLNQIILQSTLAMKIAWKMHESVGSVRPEDLDFPQGAMIFYGFRMTL